MLDVALEYHWRAGSRSEGFSTTHARAARIEMLHEAFDRAALAGGVAALEQHDNALASLLDPVLRLQQFDLQRLHMLQIKFFAEPLIDKESPVSKA